MEIQFIGDFSFARPNIDAQVSKAAFLRKDSAIIVGSAGGICYKHPMQNQLDAVFLHPEELVGTWRRFGRTGPVYQILGVGVHASPQDGMVRVRVAETGEEFDYRLRDLLGDPRES